MVISFGISMCLGDWAARDITKVAISGFLSLSAREYGVFPSCTCTSHMTAHTLCT